MAAFIATRTGGSVVISNKATRENHTLELE
jgi:hypothetical protein